MYSSPGWLESLGGKEWRKKMVGPRLKVAITSGGPHRGLETEIDSISLPDAVYQRLPDAFREVVEGPITAENEVGHKIDTRVEMFPNSLSMTSFKMLGFQEDRRLWQAPERFEPRQALNSFLQLPKRSQDLIKFLRRNALWSGRFCPRNHELISLSDPEFFWQERTSISQAWLKGIGAWSNRWGRELTLRASRDVPYYRVNVQYLQELLGVALLIELSSKSDRSPCAFPNCANFIDRSINGHSKKFCSKQCASRAATRAHRERLKAATN